MRFWRFGVVLAALALWVVWTNEKNLRATAHLVFIDEVMAGANGDSRVQFLEIVQNANGQNCWGPQVPFPATTGSDADDDDCFLGGAAETRSRTMLVFFDAQDREIGRYKFPENPPGGTNGRVLIGTAEFAALTGAPPPDFVMPALMSPVNGKVCFKNNPENSAGSAVNLCVSYGVFAGNTEGAGAPTAALSTVNAQSLGRLAGTHDNDNSQFALGAATPANNAGNTFTFPVVTQALQGEKLFNVETFGGNGRTCSTCHVASLRLGLPPSNITARFNDLSNNTFDPLFIAETAATGFDFNLNTLVVAARPTNQSGTDFLNLSGGDLQGMLTGSGGARGKVLARVNATTYRIYGGVSPPLTGLVTDAFGNRATVMSVTAGDLNGLEAPLRMRTSTASEFPNGRGLILENIDGFANPPVFRRVPQLVNLSLTAPYGLSAGFPNLQAFTTQTVRQHLPRTLARNEAIAPGANPDFRLPTAGELAALEAFLLAQEFPAGTDPNKLDVDRYVVTDEQAFGRQGFFGDFKCSRCHGRQGLAQTSTIDIGKGFGINASFDTGVVTLPINGSGADNLPCEPSVGTCDSREFNVPQLFALKDRESFFHDGSVKTLDQAVAFYSSSHFWPDSRGGRAAGSISFGFEGPGPVARFLEALGTVPTPVIDPIPDLHLRKNGQASTSFRVRPRTQTLTVQSSNPTLLSSISLQPVYQFSSLFFNYHLYAYAAPNMTGSTTVTITGTDFGGTSSRSFTVTVRETNVGPTVGAQHQLTVPEDNGPIPFPVVISDPDTPIGDLQVTATSSNPSIHTMSMSGSGTNRTLTVQPAVNAFGTANITITVSDGQLSSSWVTPLTIMSVNDSPRFAPDIGELFIAEDGSIGPLPYTISDVDDTNVSYQFSASSDNPTLFPAANLVVGGTSTNPTLTLTPAPNKTGFAIVALHATSPQGSTTEHIGVTVTPVDDLPTMSDIANRSIDEDGSTGAIPFTIADIDDPSAAWRLSADSSNPALLPAANLVFGGSGGNRTLTATPLPNQSGVATITVVAESKPGSSVTKTFIVTVNAVNDAPTIPAIADQAMVDTATLGPLAVTLADLDSAAGSLTLTATSSDAAVIPNANISIGGSGTHRTLTIVGVPGAIGSTLITLTAGDGIAVATRTFTVTVIATTTPPSPPGPPEPPPPAPVPPGPPAPPPTVQPPGAPSGLTATVSGTIVDLSWIAAPASDEPLADLPSSDPATGYRIEIGRAPGQSDAATFTTGVTTSFSVNGLLPGTYYLRVRAFNSAGDGPPSNEVVVTLAGSGAPGAPRNLRASLSGRTLQLVWDAPESGGPVIGYHVEIGSVAGLANIGSVPVAGLSLTLPDVPDGTYFIRVKAVREAGASPASNEVMVTVGAAPPPPCTAAPGAPVLTGGATGTLVVLSWTPSAGGGAATHYLLQAGAAPGLSNLASLTLASAVTSFSTPAPDGTYYLRVIAVNGCGGSPASNEVTVTIGTPPPQPPPTAAPGAPSGLTSQVIGSQVTLTWAPPVTGGAPARYIIEVSDLAGNPIISVDTGNPATTFTHTGAPSGVYAVRVRAANAGGVGPPSATATVAIP